MLLLSNSNTNIFGFRETLSLNCSYLFFRISIFNVLIHKNTLFSLNAICYSVFYETRVSFTWCVTTCMTFIMWQRERERVVTLLSWHQESLSCQHRLEATNRAENKVARTQPRDQSERCISFTWRDSLSGADRDQRPVGFRLNAPSEAQN